VESLAFLSFFVNGCYYSGRYVEIRIGFPIIRKEVRIHKGIRNSCKALLSSSRLVSRAGLQIISLQRRHFKLSLPRSEVLGFKRDIESRNCRFFASRLFALHQRKTLTNQLQFLKIYTCTQIFSKFDHQSLCDPGSTYQYNTTIK
jgi:hypothetical protein